jgi:hypothetical protein
MEIKLREKYRTNKGNKAHKKSNRGGNNGHSAGKHTPHPKVHGYRRNGYTCDPRWNTKGKD